jgi:transposase
MATPAAGAARSARTSGPHRLVQGVGGLGYHAGQKGGEKTGPNPVDRGRPGSKRHLLVDENGTPLVAVLTGAQVHDSKIFEELVDGVEPVKGPRGRPRKLHADKGYDFQRCRRFLRRRGIKARIARRAVESSQRLGRHRWVVERNWPGYRSTGGCASTTNVEPISTRHSSNWAAPSCASNACEEGYETVSKGRGCGGLFCGT